MRSPTGALKRVLVGRPLRSDRSGETTVPKWLALPIFASDPLSSVTYASQEILLVLSLGGLAFLHLAPWVALAVVVLLAVVVASYRQVVHAYPHGGGSYEVVSRNLGRSGGLVVAGALLCDYVMTVAVSVAAGIDNVLSALPALGEHRVALNLGVILVLVTLNLRGMRESARAFAVPTYLFVTGMGLMLVVGFARIAGGSPPVAESAGYGIRPEQAGLTGLALVLLLLRAFSSGCTALTGVEAISNGVPAFRRPKETNAGRTMLMMGAIAIVLFSGVTALALSTGVKVAENPCDLTGVPGDCASHEQRTVIAQLAAAVFGDDSFGFFWVQTGAALILLLAANTAFNGFPMLASILARDRYLPRQLLTRGDRLAHSNGIILLAVIAGVLIAAFEGSVTGLIQLYILGVFTSFTLSQIGMVKHWNAELAGAEDAAARRRIHRSRLINGFGAAMTGIVLVVVLVTKFTHGAYLVVIAIPVLYWVMRFVSRHYGHIREELALEEGERTTLPARVHAVVLVSTLNKAALRALSYARATSPESVTAISVDVDADETRALREDWDRHRMEVPLTILESPYREVIRPVVAHVKRLGRDGPDELVCVYIPEYAVGRWWEDLLHNQTALRLRGRLLFERSVMVASVPWQLRSSALHDLERVVHRPGDLRRGISPRPTDQGPPE